MYTATLVSTAALRLPEPIMCSSASELVNPRAGEAGELALLGDLVAVALLPDKPHAGMNISAATPTHRFFHVLVP